MVKFISIKILILFVCGNIFIVQGRPMDMSTLKGIVTDSLNNPVEGATVSLVKQKVSRQTNAKGEFEIYMETESNIFRNAQIMNHNNSFRLQRDGMVVCDLEESGHLEVSLFDRSGRLVVRAFNGFSERGRRQIPLFGDNRLIADQIYQLVVSTNSGKMARTVVHTQNGFSNVSSTLHASATRAFGKTVAALDTLIIKKSGYFMADTLEVLSAGDHDFGTIKLRPIKKTGWITFSDGSLEKNEWGGKQTTWCDSVIGGKSTVKIEMVDLGGDLGHAFGITYNVADGGLGWMAALGIVQFPALDITAKSTLNFKIKGDFVNGISFNVTMVSRGDDGGFRTEFSIDKVHSLNDVMTDVTIPLHGDVSWNPTTGPQKVFDPKGLVEIQFKVWQNDVAPGSKIVVDDIRFE